MKKQRSAVFRGTHAGKSVAVAMFLCGLRGVVPHLADPHGEVAMVTEPALVSIPFVDAVSSKHHPLEIAIPWYDANLRTEYAVGAAPVGVIFDGTNIWVVNRGSANVTKLLARDGSNLGAFAVGSGPQFVAFDGANIWVTNTSSNNVTKLRASDGSNLGTFAVGSRPAGVTFDGADILVEASRLTEPEPLLHTESVKPGAFVVPYGTVSAVELDLLDVMDKGRAWE